MIDTRRVIAPLATALRMFPPRAVRQTQFWRHKVSIISNNIIRTALDHSCVCGIWPPTQIAENLFNVDSTLFTTINLNTRRTPPDRIFPLCRCWRWLSLLMIFREPYIVWRVSSSADDLQFLPSLKLQVGKSTQNIRHAWWEPSVGWCIIFPPSSHNKNWLWFHQRVDWYNPN